MKIRRCVCEAQVLSENQRACEVIEERATIRCTYSPNFAYVSPAKLKYVASYVHTNSGWTNRHKDHPITRCPRWTFKAVPKNTIKQCIYYQIATVPILFKFIGIACLLNTSKQITIIDRL